MKQITLMSMAALLSVAVQGQAFTSGLETWDAGLPTDWMGAKTSIVPDSVSQVDTDVHGGTYAVRLKNGPSGHKRFTTQPVTVVAGTTYDVTFWVRGVGNVRTGLYDGRSTGSGYAPYTTYFNSTGNTWTEVTQQVTCTNDTTAGEFILSVQMTAGPEHLVIDDVNITTGVIEPPVEVPIYDIQFSTAPDGASPLAGETVLTSGIVTAVFPAGGSNPGYFIQDATGPWNGIYVFDPANIPNIGDNVVITGAVTEYFTLTEINQLSAFTVLSSGNPLPASVITSTFGAGSEQYEGVLVTASNATCTDPSAANGQWIIDNGTGPLFVSPLIYDYPNPAQGTNYDVTGPMFYSFSEWKVLPRTINDVVFATSIGEFAGSTVTLFPNPAHTMLTMDLGSVSGRTEYNVSDATGRTVLADIATTQRNTIDVSNLSNGIYVVTLRNADAVWSTRIQVQH